MAQTAPAPAGRDAFDAATAGLRFTKDFNGSLECVMHDGQATAAQRVLAWIKRKAWGNYSLHCIDQESGKPAYAADCCRELALDKTRVSHTLKYYESRGYIRTQGKLIFPLIEPEPADEKVAERRNFSEFLDYWKVAEPRNFLDLEVARREVKRLQKVAFCAYKKWRDAPPTESASLSETVETVETVNLRTLGAAPQPDNTTTPGPSVRIDPPAARTENPEPQAPPPGPTNKVQLLAWLTARTDRFGLLTLPDATALRAVTAAIPDSGTFQRFCIQVEKQKPKPKSWKYFVAIAKACAKAEAASNRLIEEERAAAAERLRAWENPEPAPAAQPEPEPGPEEFPEPPPTAEQLQRIAEQLADEAERQASARATQAARRQAEAEIAAESRRLREIRKTGPAREAIARRAKEA